VKVPPVSMAIEELMAFSPCPNHEILIYLAIQNVNLYYFSKSFASEITAAKSCCVSKDNH
jgi:hypothetical protein